MILALERKDALSMSKADAEALVNRLSRSKKSKMDSYTMVYAGVKL